MPFNLIKFIALLAISIVFAYISYIIPIYSFDNNFYGSNLIGYQYSFWDSSFITFISILFTHYFIMVIDTSLFSPGIILFYLIQIIVCFFFLLFCDKIIDDSEFYNTSTFMLRNTFTWLTLIMTFSFSVLLFYIVRMAEFFFGRFIVNKIVQNNYKEFFIEKFYKKKVEQMTRVIRSVAKFKRFYYNQDKNEVKQDENLVDQKMRQAVDEFKIKRKNTVMKKNKSNIK